MDPTYATSVAVARRILHQELEALQHEATSAEVVPTPPRA
jgi:hypothetical protein